MRAGESRMIHEAQKELPYLKKRFITTWMKVCGKGGAKHLYERLVQAYSEPGRFYHTLDRIEQSLKELDEVREHAEHPDRIEIAIWFHDAVYRISDKGVAKPDNEAQSAKWAERELRECMASEEVVSHVTDLILATRHDAVPGNPAPGSWQISIFRYSARAGRSSTITSGRSGGSVFHLRRNSTARHGSGACSGSWNGRGFISLHGSGKDMNPGPGTTFRG